MCVLQYQLIACYWRLKARSSRLLGITELRDGSKEEMFWKNFLLAAAFSWLVFLSLK